MRIRILLGTAILLLGLTSRADYSNTVMSLQPAAYWQLDETNVPAADLAANLGTMGGMGAGYFTDGATHPVAGALAGSPNTAAAFDGVAGEVAVPYCPALGMRAPFTIEAWVQPQQEFPSSDPAAVLACVNFVGAGRLGWVIYQSGNKWNFRLGSTNGYAFNQNGTNAIQAGVWYHLAAVYDGTNATMFVNGSVDAAGPVGAFAPNNGAPLEIGGAAAVQRYDQSVVDEVAVYTNVLSATAIQAHYQNGTNAAPAVAYDQLVLGHSPLLYFRLDEAAFTPGLLPTAANRGSLGAVADGHYQPGSLPGVPGVAYTGLGTANRACRFNGAQGCVDLGADSSLDLLGPVTLVAWVKGSPVEGRFQCILGKGDTSWRLAMNELGQPGFAAGRENSDVVGTFSVNDGKWHHLAGVYDGTSLCLFVDGISNAVMAAPSPIEGAANFAAIGRAPDYAERYYAGSVDEAAIFTNALTAAQIREIYESANVPPAITLSPVSQTVNEGSTLTLTGAAIGTPALTYQWTKNGTNLVGQTAAALALSNVQAGDSGSYALQVSNAFGVVISTPGVVVVQSGPPVLFRQPRSLTRYTGGTAAFSIYAGGTAPLSYQWNFNGAPIPGATATNCVLTVLQLANAGDYSCTVTNAYGLTNSVTVSLGIVSAPTDAYAAAVLADHPLAFWRLGETSGTVARDYVGGHNGQYTNVLLNQPGYSLLDADKAAAFGPARNSYVADIRGIDFATASSTAAFSVEAWVKCPYGQGGDVGIVAKGEGNGGEQFSLDMNSGGNYRFLVRDVYGDVQTAESAIPPDNTWQHIVGVCNEPDGSLRLYINGEEWASAAISSGILDVNHPVSIGSRQSGDGDYDFNLNGLLDEVAIYDYALSEPQIAAHFNSRYGPGQAPVIGMQPAPVTNYVSLPVTFTVEAAGTPPLAYQWQFDSADIPGANGNTFTLASLDATNAGYYSVVVSNPSGTNNSDAVQLTVLPVPTVVDVSSGLVLHLKLDGDYVDWSGRGNHGTNVGATTFLAGAIGAGALHYESDGEASFNYVSLGWRPDLQFGSNVNFSIAYWIRYPADDRSDDLPILANAAFSTYNPGYVFTQTAGGWLWTLGDAAGNLVPAIGGGDSINDGAWHHLVHTFDRAGNAITYLDSVPVDSRPIGHPGGSSLGDLDTGAPTNLGQDANGTYVGYPEYGYIVSAAVDVDDVGVWQRVLAPLEVAGMFAVGGTHHTSFATVPLQITVQSVTNQVQLSWPAGILQSADDLSGAFVDLPGATSPHLVTPSEPRKFYRLRQ